MGLSSPLNESSRGASSFLFLAQAFHFDVVGRNVDRILLRENDNKEPYPLSWQEQAGLFNELPQYLSRNALFKVSTGTRDQEGCNLRWEWEVPIPEMAPGIFIVPGHTVKNRHERLVVLNQVVKAVIDEGPEQAQKYPT